MKTVKCSLIFFVIAHKFSQMTRQGTCLVHAQLQKYLLIVYRALLGFFLLWIQSACSIRQKIHFTMLLHTDVSSLNFLYPPVEPFDSRHLSAMLVFFTYMN